MSSLSTQLLDRETFRLAVFDRDNHLCVKCARPAKDAHHIMERRLFDDGGYYLDNGVSLCEGCHLLAEKTRLSTDELRCDAGIATVILPDHLYADYEYDKWGNIVNPNGTRIKGELFYDESVQKVLEAGGVLSFFQKYVKYPRTYHLPYSPGRTEDDKTLPDCSIFEGKEVVVTAKMDGENTTGYWDGYIHARSIDGERHESQAWIRKFLAGKLFELPENFRICGENCYAKHSIYYRGLESYFYLFSIWNAKNECLSWDDTVEWANLLDIKTVPVLYRGPWDENFVKQLYHPCLNGNELEGYVVRLADSFSYAAFRKSVGKFVRAEHVQTNQHWKRTKLMPNELTKN